MVTGTDSQMKPHSAALSVAVAVAVVVAVTVTVAVAVTTHERSHRVSIEVQVVAESALGGRCGLCIHGGTEGAGS